MIDDDARIDRISELRGIYRPAARRAIDKEITCLDAHCRDFIAHATLAVLATTDGAGKVDLSPKGGPAGFVTVLDDNRLAIPDMAGNNRLDSMSNIVADGAASLLFVVPAIDETLRVIGRASLSTAKDILDVCPIRDMTPNVAIVVTVSSVFIHCGKALRRAGLWDQAAWPDTAGMASPACMLKDHIGLPGSVADSQQALDHSYRKTTWAMGGEEHA